LAVATESVSTPAFTTVLHSKVEKSLGGSERTAVVKAYGGYTRRHQSIGKVSRRLLFEATKISGILKKEYNVNNEIKLPPWKVQ
jgi:hypothetical protein